MNYLQGPKENLEKSNELVKTVFKFALETDVPMKIWENNSFSFEIPKPSVFLKK